MQKLAVSTRQLWYNHNSCISSVAHEARTNSSKARYQVPVRTKSVCINILLITSRKSTGENMIFIYGDNLSSCPNRLNQRPPSLWTNLRDHKHSLSPSVYRNENQRKCTADLAQTWTPAVGYKWAPLSGALNVHKTYLIEICARANHCRHICEGQREYLPQSFDLTRRCPFMPYLTPS